MGVRNHVKISHGFLHPRKFFVEKNKKFFKNKKGKERSMSNINQRKMKRWCYLLLAQ